MNDFRERGLLASAADNIAWIDEVLAHQPVEWRPHFCVAEIEFSNVDLGLGRGKFGFRLFRLEVPIVDHYLRRGAFLLQRRVSVNLCFR